MSYGSKQSKPDSEQSQKTTSTVTTPTFSDQRASTATQLKQQNIMRAAHSPNVIQQMTSEEEPIQGEFESEAPAQLYESAAAKPNNTGLPENLKSGIENLSGYSMDDVKVHFNSDKPAQLNAHAYAQGTDIHVAPGQEQHLPHEAWHVVQQKQGRVQATMQMKAGVPVNDDAGLENEADVMGAKALIQPAQLNSATYIDFSGLRRVAQLKTKIDNKKQTLSGNDKKGNPHSLLAGKKMEAQLDPQYPVQGSTPANGADFNMYKELTKYWSEPFIKGHLLNDNLGGLGIRANLFPITATANKSHLTNVERHAKEALLDLDEQVTSDPRKRGSYVYYTVEANPNHPADFIKKPKSTLTCSIDKVLKSTDPMFQNRSERVLRDRAIVSEPSGDGDDGQNERLEALNWGSSGSGMRSGAAKLKYIDDSSTGGYYHVEFSGSDEYKKWEYKNSKWSLVSSDDQAPNKISK